MNDVFDAPPPNFTNQSKPQNPQTPVNIDPISSTSPIFDKPVYDDDDDYEGGEDIFDGVFGLKKNSSSVFPTAKENSGFDGFDLFGNLDTGKMEVEGKSNNRSSRKKWEAVDTNFSAFDDLMPGFGRNTPSKDRESTGTGLPQQSNVPSTISTSSVIEEPFVVLQTDSPSHASSMLFTEPLEQIDERDHSRSRKVDVSSVGEISDDIHAASEGLLASDVNNKKNDEIRLGTNPYRTHNFVINESNEKSSIKISENASKQKIPSSNFREFHQSLFELPASSSAFDHAFTQNGCHTNTSYSETGSHMGRSSNSEDDSEASDDVWLTVSDITLTTLPTRAPPPSRSPPKPQHSKKSVKGYHVQSKDADVFSSFYHSGQSNWTPQTIVDAVKSSHVSTIDELEDSAMDRPQMVTSEHGNLRSGEVAENSTAEASAAAMKVAMDRAEAKFKHAREAWERKNAAKNSGAQRELDEKVIQDVQQRDVSEKQGSQEREKQQNERDENDREERKMEKERAQAWENEKKREREKGRQAVDRAMKEVRERAAVEARQKAERAAVNKVNAGARERAERAAVQRVQAEARERAATVARERAAKAASEALERKNVDDKEKAAAVARAETEARIRADRAFVNRATAEAQERAASAAIRRNQQKSESDLNYFFNASAHSDHASRSSSSDSGFDAQLHNRHVPERSVRPTSSGTRNVSSTSTVVDDLTSIFGAAPQSGDPQEVVGESDERRRSRLERDQRMQERSEKALADKHERDRHTQWEQAERQRMAEPLDFEIKRWAAGKEGNLRALLSTLQYVLWPECGWQPVSLTDLITSASVKKVYRKATLCIHPDKVQQKGANLQQKYIAEKVFDLLKEAWNKLNSEELI